MTDSYAIAKIEAMATAIPYLSTPAFAAAIGITEARVRQLAASGEIKAEKFGRDWHIDPTEVERVLASPQTRGRPRTGRSDATAAQS